MLCLSSEYAHVTWAANDCVRQKQEGKGLV
jgi:hypothetical protein